MAQLPLRLNVVGGDVNAFRAGAGHLLRAGIAQLVALQTGTAAEGVLITGIQTNSSLVATSTIAALQNATGNSSATGLNASSVIPGVTTSVPANDPVLNAPLSRRRLLPASQRRLQTNYGFCAPITLSGASVLVPVSNVDLVFTLPPSLYASLGAFSAAQVAQLAERVRLGLLSALGNATVVQRTLKPFLDVWADCTG